MPKTLFIGEQVMITLRFFLIIGSDMVNDTFRWYRACLSEPTTSSNGQSSVGSGVSKLCGCADTACGRTRLWFDEVPRSYALNDSLSTRFNVTAQDAGRFAYEWEYVASCTQDTTPCSDAQVVSSCQTRMLSESIGRFSDTFLHAHRAIVFA